MLSLRRFMFDRVYLAEASRDEHRRAAEVIRRILDHLEAEPDALQPGDADPVQRLVDFVAGMTDRYAQAYADAL
jgi:dGTPase